MAPTKQTHCGAALALALLIAAGVGAQDPPTKKAGQAAALSDLAVIVNQKNPTTGLTLPELRARCKLDMKWWSSGEPVRVYVHRPNTPEMKCLLTNVYRMTSGQLRKYWHGREFRGEITKRPTVVPTSAAAISNVRANAGAISVILAKDVPKGVRVLAIDGKRPGEAGYSLTVQAETPKAGRTTP